MSLAIGLGAELRGDDAAGLLVARLLGRRGLRAQEYTGDAAGLVELWRGETLVALIDAVVSGAPPGAIHVWNGNEASFLRAAFRSSTHSGGLAEAIALARALDRMPATLRIYGIEVRQFEFGCQPADAVLKAVELAAARIAKEMECTTPE